MVIHKALLKYGHSSFSLEILEYCEITKLLARKQFYIDHLKSGYYLSLTAGSPLGVKRSKETRLKISLAKKGIKLSMEIREKISETQKGENYPNFGNPTNYKHSEKIRKILSQAKRTIIFIYSLKLELINIFPSS